MNSSSFTPARRVNLRFHINRRQFKSFVLLENGEDVASVTGWTWEFFLKKNPGDRLKIFSLTLNNGLYYETYSTYTLIADLSVVQSAIEEGDYYFELVRTDIPTTWICGTANFTFGPVDSQTP